MSAAVYVPDPEAVPTPPWDTVYLSQRDVSLQIPINYVNQPGISVTKACFARNVYDDTATRKCLSNLLAMGFRRIVVDVYWDAARGLWSLCPAEIPQSASVADDASTYVSIISTSQAHLSTVNIGLRDLQTDTYLPARSVAAAAISMGDDGIFRRQGSAATSASVDSQLTTQPPSSTSSSVSLVETTAPVGGETLISIGPYSCSATMQFSLITNVLAAFLEKSSNTIDAHLTYLIINVHASSSFRSPTQPAQAPSTTMLPASNNSLGYLVNVNLSSYIYTPHEVFQERANLNASWYSVGDAGKPDHNYYTSVPAARNTVSTPDGWPSESVIEIREAQRLLVGFGTVDPQMAAYNFSQDASLLFAPGYLQAQPSVSLSQAGAVTAGCHFDTSTPSLTPRTNSSWAISSSSIYQTSQGTGLSNVTTISTYSLNACGISPFVNETLSDITADTSPTTFKQLVYAMTVWSWAPLEPRNSTGKLDNKRPFCAAMDSASGRWVVLDCAERHAAACRASNSPYEWHISSMQQSYSRSALHPSCPANTVFAVPRTALENSYLYAALLRHLEEVASDSSAQADPTTGSQAPSQSQSTPDLPSPSLIFLNINSLNQPDCWVPDLGPNALCPYLDNRNSQNTRTVVIPTVAAVIVFLTAALTIFIKCGANRRDERRGGRRKERDAGEWEGVPA